MTKNILLFLLLLQLRNVAVCADPVSPRLLRGAQNHSTTTKRDNDEDEIVVRYYAKARTDQSGRQMVRFLQLDAVAWVRGGVVGGACPDFRHSFKALTPDDIRRHVNETERLLSYLGLQDLFRFECPSQEDLDSGKAIFLTTKQVKSDTTTMFTPEWLASLRNRVSFPYDDDNNNNNEITPSSSTHTTTPIIQPTEPSTATTSTAVPRKPLQVAVHVRRGDVTPCSRKKAVVARYLPNAFYAKLLDTYLPQYCGGDAMNTTLTQNCNVTIYTESETLEDFAIFQERGYHMNLDGHLGQVWTDMIRADILVTSQSAFSYVPAFLNRHVVIQPQYFELPPLPGWVVIPYSSNLLVAARLETEQLAAQHCGQT